METISMRGTMTSCSFESLSDITAEIICSSSASSTPSWLPCSTMSRISAAESFGVRVGSMPNGLEITFVSKTRSPTSGLSTLAKIEIGPDADSAIRSGFANAKPFGINSPRTIETIETSSVTKSNAIGAARSPIHETPLSGAATSSTMLIAATADASAPRKVIAT